MIRIIYILIGLFNIFVMSKAWALPLHYILKPIQNIFPPIGAISIIGLFIFLIVHSIMLILYKIPAIRIQTILCIIDPFFRVFTLLKGIKQFPDSKYIPAIIFISVVYILIDLSIIYFMRSSKNLEVGQLKHILSILVKKGKS